jgi:hypothetical protein
MANTIKHKRSSTAGSAPLAANLADGELALNTADGSIYMKDSGGNVIKVGQNFASFNADIIPSADLTYNLGSASKQFHSAYIGPGSLYVNGQKVLEEDAGTIVISADDDQNVQIRTGGGGDIELYASGTGAIEMKSSLSIQSGKNLLSNDGNPISCTVGFTMNGETITNLATPSAASDAATKGYVDGKITTGFTLTDGSNSSTISGSDTLTVNSGTGTVAAISGDSFSYSLATSGVTAGTYGSASLVPILTVDAYGRVTSASTTSVAGVSNFTWNSTSETLTIATADGGSYSADISGMASEAYVTSAVSTAVSNLLDGAPDALNTLNELAAAINDDASYATTLTTALGTKLNLSGGTMTGALTLSGAPTATLHAATKGYVDSALSSVLTVTDGTNSTSLGDGSTLTFAGTANEVTVAESLGTVTIGLPSTITADVTGNASTASAWATARTLSLTGAVTGSASVDGSGNVSLATTATSDPTLTLAGDCSGSATFTNLGNATLTVTIADDSHNHITSNIDGLEEYIQDVAGAMVSTNTESGIAVTYDDTNGKLNFDVNDPVITLNGDVSGSATMTNLGNTTITVTIADDSHNHTIANVDGLQAALDLKAPLASPALTGTPTAPTATAATNNTQVATTAYVTTAISNLIGGAPAALDTLNELAAAINDDASYASTITTALGGKVGTSSAQALGSAANVMTVSNATITLARGDGTTDVVTVNNVANANACSGNAATATTATNANNLYIYDDNTGDTNCPILFSATTTAGYKAVYEDSALYFDNTNNTLYSTIFSGTATAARYADLAEKYAVVEDIEPGTVVCFGGDAEVQVCDHDMDRKVAGVVSTDPAYMMNSDAEGVYVALTGRVPCKVVGPVRKGDMMVSAGNGAARAEENPALGSVIGKALENFDGDEGVIEVVVGRL